MPDLTLDPKTTALVAIDLQNGIVRLPVTPHAAADVIERTARIAAKLRAAGGLIVFVRVANHPDGGDVLAPATDSPPPPAAARPADWSEFAEDVGHGDGDVVVTKRNWGAFYGTDLDLQLRRRGIKTIILVGIATNIGVESTARDAYEHGYDQVFVEDACSAMNAEAHAASFKQIFNRIGKVRTTEEVKDAL